MFDHDSWCWLQSFNASQISYEWPVTFLDTVEWVQHPQVGTRGVLKDRTMD